jgi:O-antigen biosynthesis protein WbqP
MEVVVVRPTLVYGPGVKANFLNMMKTIFRSIPLPLASITNKRSLIFIGNLVDALIACASHPAAAGQTYLVSDGEDVSTPELIRRTAIALGATSRIFHFPVLALRHVGNLIGKGTAINRLTGTLVVDSSKIQEELGWAPPYTMDEGLRLTAEWFKYEKRQGNTMKRSFDLACSFVACVLLAIPMLFAALAVKITSTGPILYWSDRIGKNNAIFKMPKFRTMRVDTPAVATHLLGDPDRWLTPVGRFLRISSLDELPQLYNIITGEMSIVGPRPALFNQYDLIELRTQKGIHSLTPGLTGWAQINGRDELSIPLKVEFDEWYLRNCSFSLDLKIIVWTFIKVMSKEGVTH